MKIGFILCFLFRSEQSWTVPVLASVLLQKEFQEQKHIHLWVFFLLILIFKYHAKNRHVSLQPNMGQILLLYCRVKY